MYHAVADCTIPYVECTNAVDFGKLPQFIADARTAHEGQSIEQNHHSLQL